MIALFCFSLFTTFSRREGMSSLGLSGLLSCPSACYAGWLYRLAIMLVHWYIWLYYQKNTNLDHSLSKEQQGHILQSQLHTRQYRKPTCNLFIFQRVILGFTAVPQYSLCGYITICSKSANAHQNTLKCTRCIISLQICTTPHVPLTGAAM